MRLVAIILFGGLLAAASTLDAEPMFLSKQYARCTACHYSPTGGGLLTEYGRSLTKEELSTSTADNAAFLWGAFGDLPKSGAPGSGGLQVGFDTRPAHLHVAFPGGTADQNIFMTADLLAAYRVNAWTLYAEVGRVPQTPGSKIDSYEYWASYQSAGGVGLRFGRFLPAFGLRFADHTAFNRRPLGLDISDQVYGVEVSRSTDRDLIQATIGPGRAESILHDDGRRAVTASGRYQLDLTPRTLVVVSGLFRGASSVTSKTGLAGAAFGFAPTARVSILTEGDAQFVDGAGGTSWTFVNETAVEAVRGIWLKVSPQLRTQPGIRTSRIFRTVFEADVLPRTHWNVDASFYVDRNNINALVTKTFLVQLHMYL